MGSCSSGASWMSKGFVLPQDEKELKKLANEVRQVPPLKNLKLINGGDAKGEIRRVVLSRVVDKDVLLGYKGSSIDSLVGRLGAQLSQVCLVFS